MSAVYPQIPEVHDIYMAPDMCVDCYRVLPVWIIYGDMLVSMSDWFSECRL